MQKPPLKVFITYSHKNFKKMKSFVEAAAVMVQNGEIALWCDADILAGEEFREKIKTKLQDADLLVYLVSASSLASEECKNELIAALLRAGKRIDPIAVVLEHCDVLNHPLAEFEVLPTQNKALKPISDWNPQSRGWQNVVDGMRKAVKNRPVPQPQPQTPAPPAGGAPLPPPVSPSSAVPLTPAQAIADSLFQRANLSLFLGNHAAAIPAYTEILNIKPDYAEAYNNRGIAYGKAGDYARAIADYNKAIELNPNSAETYSNRGNVYAKQGKNALAIADFDEAIRLKPDYAIAYNNRAGVYTNQAEHARAIKDYKKAIELQPNFARVHVNLGNVYFHQADYASAINCYKKAIELNPDFAEAHKCLGDVYFQKGNYNAAIVHYGNAIEAKPDFAVAHFVRGYAKAHLDDRKGARADCQTALQLAKKQGDKELVADAQKCLSGFPLETD